MINSNKAIGNLKASLKLSPGLREGERHLALGLGTAIQAWAGIKARLAKWEGDSLELGESEGKWEKAGGR